MSCDAGTVGDEKRIRCKRSTPWLATDDDDLRLEIARGVSVEEAAVFCAGRRMKSPLAPSSRTALARVFSLTWRRRELKKRDFIQMLTGFDASPQLILHQYGNRRPYCVEPNRTALARIVMLLENMID